MDKPIKNSYCVIPDKIYAGEYAGDLHNPEQKVTQLEMFGITHIIDLTEDGELKPYKQLLDSYVEHRPETMNVIPEWVSELKHDEIFVFGCRRSGRHYEGAPNFAREHFGAIVGQGEGLQGQSYAIPTVGVGLGFWDVEHIAPIFRAASKLSNM